MNPDQRVPHWIGYSTLDELLAVLDLQQPIYAHATTETAHEFALNQYVTVAQPDEAGNVHYWRFYCGQAYRMLEEFPAVQRDRRRHDSAWHLIRDFLAEAGHTVREATIAHPTTLRLLRGSQPAWMRYEKEAAHFTRQPTEVDEK